MNWTWEIFCCLAGGSFMVWTGSRAIQRREISVDQESGDPVTYTEDAAPFRFWFATIAPLIIGIILLGRFLWLVFQ